MVADNWSEWVYFAGGNLANCVVRVKRNGVVEAISADNGVYRAPVFREDFVVFGDAVGKIYVQRKSDITSTSPVNRYVTSIADGAPAFNGPVLLYNNGLLYAQGTSSLRVYSTIGPRLQFLYAGAMPGSSRSTKPWIFGGTLYGVTTNGTMVRFELTSRSSKLPVISATDASTSYPLITPFGTFIFSNFTGIFAVSYTGQNLWNITRDSDGQRLAGCSNVAYRLGLAYVMCGARLRIVDVLRGRIYQESGNEVNEDFTPIVFVDTTHQESLSIVYQYGITVSFSRLSDHLYHPSELPPPVPSGTPAPSQHGCRQYTTCYNCTTSPEGNCGWCGGSHQQCMAGTSSGPTNGECPHSWDWLGTQCSAVEHSKKLNK